MSESAVLMSIRPVYADAILAGEKTVELRRRRPAFPNGTAVLIYSSAPHQEVRGAFRTGAVLAAAPDDLWALVSDQAGVTREAFDRYFAGCDTGYAIEVCEPRRLKPTRLTLRPPQSYLMLHRTDDRHTTLWHLATAVRPSPVGLTGRAASAARVAVERVAAATRAAAKPPVRRTRDDSAASS
jgi:predicted transcriptional regulator